MAFGPEKTASWKITADFQSQIPVDNRQINVLVYHDDEFLKEKKLTCEEMKSQAKIVETVYFNTLLNDKHGSGHTPSVHFVNDSNQVWYFVIADCEGASFEEHEP